MNENEGLHVKFNFLNKRVFELEKNWARQQEQLDNLEKKLESYTNTKMEKKDEYPKLKFPLTPDVPATDQMNFNID